MKKRTLLYLFAILLVMPSHLLKAEVDTLAWKRLIISEIKLINLAPSLDYGYLELYNASKDTMNMMDYWLQADWNRIGVGNNAKEEGEFKGVIGKLFMPDYSYPTKKDNLLPPGKTLLITTVTPKNSTNAWGERSYPNDYFHPEIWKKADRILDLNGKGGTAPLNYGAMLLSTSQRVGLFYRGDTSTVEGVVARDSVMVDRFQNDKGDGNSANDSYVAGVITNSVGFDYIYARKFSIKKGEDNFEISAGSNFDDSEWIVMPRARMAAGSMFEKAYTTIGVHENTTELDMTPKDPSITINKTDSVINFPYGIRRDSLFRYFDFGPNHSWDLILNSDTSQWYVSTGDTIEIYINGDKLNKYSFHAEVADVPTQFAKVRPAIIKNEITGNWQRRYVVSDGETPMDTIGNVGYATPTDTLEKYLEWEKGAELEYIFADGKENIELKKGDKLKVTSGSTTKTYLISVDRYAPSHQGDLRAIYMPGLEIWENPETFEYTDTLITFNPKVKDYIVTLPSETEVPPAIVATAESNRAVVNVARPANLNGDDAARTAVITVTAEDDTTINEYHILFNVEREEPPVIGEPFISDLAFNWKGNGSSLNYQIYNPSNDPIDLSNYTLVIHNHHGGAPNEWGTFIDYNSRGNGSLFTDRSTDKGINARILRPSYWVNADAEGDCYYVIDPNFTNAELFSKEVYSMASTRGFPLSDDYWKNAPGGRGDDRIKFNNKLDLVMSSRGPGNSMNTAGWGPGWYLSQRLNYSIEDGKADPANWPYGSDMWPLGHNDWESPVKNGGTFLLYKIKNDSVADGTKPINKNFLEDHELIDVFNDPVITGTPWTVYDKVNGVDSAFRWSTKTPGILSACLERKPWVFTGNPEPGASMGTPGHEGEWMVYGIAADGSIAKETIPGVTLGAAEYGQTRFENHTMITYAHIPYITSEVYLIGKGLEGVQPIIGVPANTSVDMFMQSIIKPDTGMKVQVMDASGSDVSGADIIETGYKVKSTSANTLSSVDYEITVGELSSDVSLSAKSGSGLTVEGKTIKGVKFGTTLIDLLDNLVPAVGSQMTPTNGNEMIIPTEAYNNDTLMIQAKFRVEVLASTNHIIEVKAQNGVDVAEYTIEFGNEEDIYVMSSVYKVYEEFKTLDFVHWTSVEAFMRNIIVSPGATAKIINKISQERTDGIIQFDDRLVLEKDGKQVIYILKFVNDDRFGVKVKDVEPAIAGAVYPNPTKGMITINDLHANEIIEISNLAGQMVSKHNVSDTQMNIEVGGAAGVYILTVKNEQGNTIQSIKIVKQ